MPDFPKNINSLRSALLAGAKRTNPETLDNIFKSLDAIETSMEKFMEGPNIEERNAICIAKNQNDIGYIGGVKKKEKRKNKVRDRVDVGQFGIVCSDKIKSKLPSGWRQIPTGLFTSNRYIWRYPTMTTLGYIYTNSRNAEVIMKYWTGLKTRLVCFYDKNKPIDDVTREKMVKNNWIINQIVDLPMQLSSMSSSKPPENSSATRSAKIAKIAQKPSNEKLPSSSSSFVPNLKSSDSGSAKIGLVSLQQQQSTVKMPNFSTEFKIGPFLHGTGNGDGLGQNKMVGNFEKPDERSNSAASSTNSEKYTFTMLKNKETSGNAAEVPIPRKTTDLTMDQYKIKMGVKAACENSKVLQKIPLEFREFYINVQFDETIDIGWKIKLDQVMDENRELKGELGQLENGNNF
ncbi:unnamed protein product [Caenorhabditis angaria]|uniref:Uncharacterized protein n=1 Tax=Caenorhabditis angaria TaxID=860376 RepID=A0A9P1IYY9_9PELO|nr:unnamed protein product [Caenorhabditis angaria]